MSRELVLLSWHVGVLTITRSMFPRSAKIVFFHVTARPSGTGRAET